MENETLRSDIQINGYQATWTMKLEGDVQGTYSGNFTFRCFLNPLQTIAANREYRELLGPNPTSAPEHESFLAYSLTQLKYRIISAPPFWNSTIQDSAMAGNIPDENIISAVLSAAIDSEILYKSQLKSRKEAALKTANAAVDELVQNQTKPVEKLP